MSSESSKRALVLSGGGARGAYEAGVLRYILDVLPTSLGHRPKFDILCGTSVGAINAAWLAATIDDPTYCVERLEELWRSLIFQDVVQFSYREIWHIFRRLVVDPRISLPEPVRTNSREGGFLETGFFDELIRREIPFDAIARNIDQGIIDAVSVSATDIITGQTTVFVQSADHLPPWTRDARRIAADGPMTANKVLASAAIPLLFPAVPIDDHWYCDGGLRQNTPISPALRLGADKILIISLKSRSFEEQIDPRLELAGRKTTHPTLPFMLGKLLDALLLDPLDYDLDVLERVNAILDYGEEAFGDGSFVDELNRVIRAHRGQGYRKVEPLLIRPARDLGTIAAETARAQSDDFWGSLPLRLIVGQALRDEGARESDLMSYLLFDNAYTGKLFDMGFADAEENHDGLVEFFAT